MKTFCKNLSLIAFFILCYSCNDIHVEKVSHKDVVIDSEKMEIEEPKFPDPPVEIAAYLVYKDNTVSSFDVLHSKGIVLWNTITGGGDTEKPSQKIKIVLKGQSQSFRFVVYNGKQKAVDRNLAFVRDSTVFFINNTGCEEVKIQLARSGKLIYENRIPFKCGE